MKRAASTTILLLAGCLFLSCEGGDPPLAQCPAGQTECPSGCANLQTDNANCGQCGFFCPEGTACNGAGMCVLTCGPGQENCDGVCVNTSTDREHCGQCDRACDAGEICDGAGQCALSCQAGLLACDGTCVDPMTSRAYCGATGDCEGANAGEACAAGFVCDGSGDCALSCQAGLLACGGTCVDPDSNPTYCGASGDCTGDLVGTECGTDQACVDGECADLAL